MELLVLICLGLVGYTYFGYPLVLAAWAGVREALDSARFVLGGSDRRLRCREDRLPMLTVVVAAHDEEEWIQQKVANCLSADYPADRLEVLVGCDGCTDRTVELARVTGGGRITVHDLPRAGKASVLSYLVPRARGDVVVLTDANVMLETGALKALARRFQDPSVGAVVGRLRFWDRRMARFEEGLYWKYETVLKHFEGKCGCVLGANGGIYAVRRDLFPALRASTITDDFVVAVRIAAAGWRVPYEPGAVAFEELTGSGRGEFERRARIGAGNWQSLALVPGLLDPRSGFLHFAFVSHKLLRWLAPLFLLAAFVVSVPLTVGGGVAWSLLLVAQLVLYSLALAGPPGRGGTLQRARAAAHHFVWMNAALAVGFWRFVRGSQQAAWRRTERPPGVRAA